MIATLSDLKSELAWVDDLGETDDDLMTGKLAAAQNHVERLLGYKIEEQYGGQGQEPVPPSLRQAVIGLAAHWYENRGAVGRDAEAPYWVADLIAEYREWTF